MDEFLRMVPPPGADFSELEWRIVMSLQERNQLESWAAHTHMDQILHGRLGWKRDVRANRKKGAFTVSASYYVVTNDGRPQLVAQLYWDDVRKWRLVPDTDVFGDGIAFESCEAAVLAAEVMYG